MGAQRGYQGESGGGRKPGNSEPEKRYGRSPDTADVRNLVVKRNKENIRGGHSHINGIKQETTKKTPGMARDEN